MAGSGRIPGVSVPPRRRSEHHPRNHHGHQRRNSYLTDSLEISSLTALDDTSIQAKQRLHKKLGHFFSSLSCRARDNPKKEASSWLRGTKFKKERKVCAVCVEHFQQNQQVMNVSCSHKYHSACLLPRLGRKLLECSWLCGTKFKKERKVCAVCLEDFQQKQQVMNLSCSHKYHSACLLPWLQAHPHCPCCRTLVQ